MKTLIVALVFPALATLACGDVVDGLSATSAESALCRDTRCADPPSKNTPDDDAAPAAPAYAGDAGAPGACQSDADCAAGDECEYEHGIGYCKPHGGHDEREDGHDSRDDHPAADGGTDASSLHACYEDLDCAYGERCESIGGGQRACSTGDENDRSGPDRGRH